MNIYIKDNALCIKVTDVEIVRYDNDCFECLDDLRELQRHFENAVKEKEEGDSITNINFSPANRKPTKIWMKDVKQEGQSVNHEKPKRLGK